MSFQTDSQLIADPMSIVSKEDIEHLRLFIIIQMFRTVQAIEKTRAQFQLMHSTMFHDIDEAPDPGELSDKNLVMSNIKIALKFYPALTDLRYATVINGSAVSLFTSDSPALATNRLFLQKFKTDNFGLGQSGIILYLPISPKLGIIFYDMTYIESSD